MTTLPRCDTCGAREDEPCRPGCSCMHCEMQGMPPLPCSVEGCIDAANIAIYAGREREAAIHMIRAKHIAAGLS